MSGTGNAPALDRERIRELFDLRSSYNEYTGGGYTGDPYPVWHELRDAGPVLPGTVHELTGYGGDAFFHGLPFPDRPHYSVFDYASLDAVYRNDAVFSSSPGEDGSVGAMNSMLTMGGAEHRRYRGLVQPSFVPARARWWIENWIDETIHGLVDAFVGDGRAELNVDFCAAIPLLTITGSFGVPVEQALDIRANLHDQAAITSALRDVVAARRERPEDDLISVLVQAELADEEGTTHRLTDAEIYSFAMLLLAAGSGTTWKQMGITLAAILQRPEVLAAIRDDRSLLKPAIEESVRWMPTDPMFSRWVTEDVELSGTALPKGSVLHLCLGAANRDPARWDRPDEYDIHRPLRPAFGFGGGPHICLGMHVARAEMSAGIGALLDRLPNLRLDPDAEPPRPVGLYERGVTAIPVVFDT
ncbi:MAG TPA: cytochrome P450 [Acidimicrobiales bacterium]|nr:cytochrome P450 [Acidimicrobiales bacterium]